MESLLYNFSSVRLMVFEIQIVAHSTKSSGIYFYQFFSVCLWTSIYKYKLELKYNSIVKHKVPISWKKVCITGLSSNALYLLINILQAFEKRLSNTYVFIISRLNKDK